VQDSSQLAKEQSPAGRTPRQGPVVWRDMDQRQLDDAYDQEVYAPNRLQVTGRRKALSERARPFIGTPLRLAYGPSEQEKLDLYRTDKPNAPINIFVHGGAWRGGSASAFAYQAELFIRAGAHHAVLDFINVAEADGSLFPMVEQVCRAVAFVYRNAASLGGDPAKLYLSGHSSGGHLAGCAVTHDWPADGLPEDILKGALLISGMYDLEPVRLSKRSAYVAFTDAMEAALSPQRHIARLAAPLVLAHGTNETPEFKRQTRDFHAAVQAAGKPAELIVADGYNHFELLETLSSPYGVLGRAVLRQMGIE
jgi:arylformamidase